MLGKGHTAMDDARRQVEELARLQSSPRGSKATRELVNSLGSNLDTTAELLDALTQQWEGFQARYRFGERIIRAQEEERQRVAREIHDGPAQSMANVVLRAEICERLLTAGRQEVTQELAQLKMLVKESLREVRKIIFNLRPMALDDLGLVPTLFRFLENMREQDGINISFEVLGDERRLSSTLEVALFRMIQEGVNNARKHAQASEIHVLLDFGTDTITATVHDDGIGFDVAVVQKAWHERQSFGLMSMRERIQLLNGELEVTSILKLNNLTKWCNRDSLCF
jgi:two-component system sensor histidine kinase DegS